MPNWFTEGNVEASVQGEPETVTQCDPAAAAAAAAACYVDQADPDGTDHQCCTIDKQPAPGSP